MKRAGFLWKSVENNIEQIQKLLREFIRPECMRLNWNVPAWLVNMILSFFSSPIGSCQNLQFASSVGKIAAHLASQCTRTALKGSRHLLPLRRLGFGNPCTSRGTRPSLVKLLLVRPIPKWLISLALQSLWTFFDMNSCAIMPVRYGRCNTGRPLEQYQSYVSKRWFLPDAHSLSQICAELCVSFINTGLIRSKDQGCPASWFVGQQWKFLALFRPQLIVLAVQSYR